jgi:hypothetical protein
MALSSILLFLPYTIISIYAWNISKFTDLAVFGDSWSDAGRLEYITAHNGSLPPVGWTNSEVCPS